MQTYCDAASREQGHVKQYGCLVREVTLVLERGKVKPGIYCHDVAKTNVCSKRLSLTKHCEMSVNRISTAL